MKPTRASLQANAYHKLQWQIVRRLQELGFHGTDPASYSLLLQLIHNPKEVLVTWDDPNQYLSYQFCPQDCWLSVLLQSRFDPGFWHEKDTGPPGPPADP
jgi:hypothetical protein